MRFSALLATLFAATAAYAQSGAGDGEHTLPAILEDDLGSSSIHSHLVHPRCGFVRPQQRCDRLHRRTGFHDDA